MRNGFLQLTSRFGATLHVDMSKVFYMQDTSLSEVAKPQDQWEKVTALHLDTNIYLYVKESVEQIHKKLEG